MFVFGNLLQALAHIVDIILTIMYWLIMIRALLSWVSPDPYNPIVQFLYRTTEPILEPFRRFIPPLGGMDLSPIVAFLAIIFLKAFLVRTLFDLSMRVS